MLHGYKVLLDFVDKAKNVKLPQKAVSKRHWCSKRSFFFLQKRMQKANLFIVNGFL